MRLVERIGRFLVTLGVGGTVCGQPAREIPPAYGPHVGLSARDFTEAQTFRRDDRVVGTYYFYWYDAPTRAHVVNPDGSDALTTHPPSVADLSYRSVAWHQRQLVDMMDAGVDVLLPVFWGAPSEHDSQSRLHWSYVGLQALVEARERLVRDGRRPPRIGMFYDTSTLQMNSWGVHVDLTDPFGQAWFYATLRDFFSLVPPRHWAMIEGRPMVVLYSAQFAKRYNQACVSHVRQAFARDFGGRVPYLIREVSWKLETDNAYGWGGATGLRTPGVASLGPGYDESATGRRPPLIVHRRQGRFYEENWLRFLRRPSPLVFLETWNEFHEGTDLCESKEYGRFYINLTRKYADLFKSGWRPSWPKGPYTDRRSVSVEFGAPSIEKGLRWLDAPDGLGAPANVAGHLCRQSLPNPHAGRYLYFAIDDSFKWADLMNASLEVDYYDAAPGGLGLEFDGNDPQAPYAGAYTKAPQSVPLAGNRQWKTARFELSAARWQNLQNQGADFRLVVSTPEFYVRRLRLIRR